MLLSDICQGICSHQPDSQIAITGICTDSRSVQAGDAFFAYQGNKHNSCDYIADALERNAAVVFYDACQSVPSALIDSGRLVAVANLPAKLGLFADNFYRHPSKDLNIFAVTGTNGKTSCSYLLSRALNNAGLNCGVIGTLGYGSGEKLLPLANTTPGAVELQALLAELRAKEAKHIAMEASSHALAQHRLAGVTIDTAIFTNLSQDHLDYHGDMRSYGLAKEKLFMHPGLQRAIINVDDSFGQQLATKYAQQYPVTVYSTQNNWKKFKHLSAVYAEDSQLTTTGVKAQVFTDQGQGVLQSSCYGKFNISNLLAILASLLVLPMPLPQALALIRDLPTVPGRMQCFINAGKPKVVIDYAHTPDALEQALIAVRDHFAGKICCIFGCGGNRDSSKRQFMGKIAERYSARIVITNDNPRHESAMAIVEDILLGVSDRSKVWVELDRRQAIVNAIADSLADEVVLIAGKGHETYQDFGDTRVVCSDFAYVMQGLQS